MDVQYSMNPPEPKTRIVWYEGTDELHTGYGLCFNFDYGTAASKDASRLVRAEKPATANLSHFAGVVMPNHDGAVGPCFVEVAYDGAGDVYTNQNCSGSWGIRLYPVDASYALGAEASTAIQASTSTFKQGVARSLQEIDRTTPGLVFCQLGRFSAIV